jgi:cardiolipin synthase
MLATVVCTVLALLFYLNWSSQGPSVRKPVSPAYAVDDPVFMRTVESFLGQSWTQGNVVRPLQNGDEIFPAMLSAIRMAELSINFETFIYWTGDIAIEFSEALAERARNGIEVRVLLDGVGASTMDKDLVTNMREAGAIVEFFRPVNWYHLDHINNRTHRKLLIVDGIIAFTGGVGIGDEWQGNAEDPLHWRDSHFEFRGPVVAQMQGGFIDHWIESYGEVLTGDSFFPALESVGNSTAQAFNSRGGDGGTMRTLFLLAIASAREKIYIGTPYFVPDDLLLETLLEAHRRGVEIEIMTSGRNSDSRMTQGVSRVIWGDLLEAGTRFWLFDPTLYHTKVLVVDDYFVSVGSTNFDNRSFLHNDENNVNVMDRAFAAEIIEQFESDKKRSHQITLEEWRNRPWKERLMEWWGMLFESQV